MRTPLSDVAAKLGSDWDIAEDEMVALGEALVAAISGLVGPVCRLGIDETPFMHTCQFSNSIEVNVSRRCHRRLSIHPVRSLWATEEGVSRSSYTQRDASLAVNKPSFGGHCHGPTVSRPQVA